MSPELTLAGLAPRPPTPVSSEPSDEEQHLPTIIDAEDDDSFYDDHDGAQSLMQPAISPIATRLASASTPAAEKAAAMDELPGGGLFDRVDAGAADSPPDALLPVSGPQAYQMSAVETVSPHQPLPLPDLPTPWAAGPKRFTFGESHSQTSALPGVLQSRQHRASSVSENALKRLSKALPSISIPTGFMPSIPTPSFLSSLGASSQKDGQATHSLQIKQSVPSRFLPLTHDPVADVPARPDTRSHGLRKSTSDDSLLYHSLSRVSSFGDDNRFAHVREQVNSRFKAIKDSFDGPSFKMPQFQSVFAPDELP